MSIDYDWDEASEWAHEIGVKIIKLLYDHKLPIWAMRGILASVLYALDGRDDDDDNDQDNEQ